MAAIKLEKLEKRFGAVRVVEDLHLEIAEGEFFTFVGPSGCGKSTVLSLVAGLELPTGGTIRFDGEAVNALAPRERDVAMVFQSYALYPHMTVEENIAFPLRLRGVSRAETAAAVRDIARNLGLEGLLARRPRELSGGQRQRVALGRALVRRPRVFLLDEPLSNLDARLRLEMRAELKRLHREYGITTVYVTHDQEEAMALSDRMAVLQGGRIQQCGAPLALYQDPANLFVAGFIGSPPINVLEPHLFQPAALPAPARRQDVVLGLRPADVAVDSRPQPFALAAEVVVCEPTGTDVWVLGHCQGQRIVGRHRAPTPPAPGTIAYFGYMPDRLYVFERRTGRRLK